MASGRGRVDVIMGASATSITAARERGAGSNPVGLENLLRVCRYYTLPSPVTRTYRQIKRGPRLRSVSGFVPRAYHGAPSPPRVFPVCFRRCRKLRAFLAFARGSVRRERRRKNVAEKAATSGSAICDRALDKSFRSVAFFFFIIIAIHLRWLCRGCTNNEQHRNSDNKQRDDRIEFVRILLL